MRRSYTRDVKGPSLKILFFPVDIIVYWVTPVFDFVMLDWINFQQYKQVAYNLDPYRVEHFHLISVVVKPACLCKQNCHKQETQIQPAIDIFLTEDWKFVDTLPIDFANLLK